MSGSGKSNSDQKKSVSEPSKTVVLKLRLFVGGLGPTVGSIDLQQRFAPLGTVYRIDLVDGKKGWDAEQALQRGFAYVDFEASSEASLQKLFSAYNGCKWKGGVLRVEKAKEHYMDRLRREWAEAEVEAAAKAKITEEAAAKATTESRPMYSYKSEGLSGSLDFNRADLDEEGDGTAIDADVIAAQIEKERKTHLDLLSKLFPEDKDAGDEEEKIVEIVKLRAFPLPTDVNAKKRKHVKETPTVPVEDATVVQPSTHEHGAVDENNKQSSKSRRVKFSEASDARPNDKMASDAAKDVRPILKKMQMDEDRNEEGEEDGEEEEEGPSSRSPSPEGGLSDESKWKRLYKYAGLKKEREAPKPSSTLTSGPTLWTGISLDDDDTEAAVAEVEAPERIVNDGIFSGVLSEQEDEESDPPQEKSIGDNSVGGDSDLEEETDLPEARIFGNGVHDSKESAKLTKEPEASSETLPNEDEQSSDGSEEPESSDSESDDDEETEDFVDAAPVVKSPLDEAAKASKWAKMFKSATSAAEPAEGVFSGSLDEADVPMRPRPALKVPRMFESASANHTEAPKVSADIVTSEAMDYGSRRNSVEGNPSTSCDGIPNQSDIKVASQEEEDDKQNGDTRSNLLSLFNMEQDGPQDTGGHGESSSVPLPEGQNGVDDNTKWIQRATWKSLMGADGRATFSLKQLTREAETTTKAAEVKKSDSMPKHSFSAFSFNFTHNAAPEAKRESVSIEQRAEKVPEPAEKQSKAVAAKAPDEEAGCSFMKSADAEKEWRASRSQLRMDSRAKHKAAVRKMKKMKGSGGAR